MIYLFILFLQDRDSVKKYRKIHGQKEEVIESVSTVSYYMYKYFRYD